MFWACCLLGMWPVKLMGSGIAKKCFLTLKDRAHGIGAENGVPAFGLSVVYIYLKCIWKLHAYIKRHIKRDQICSFKDRLK